MMRQRLVLFFLMYMLTGQGHAEVQTCGYSCLSTGDKQTFQTARAAFSRLIPALNRFGGEIQQTPRDDFVSAALVHKRFAFVSRETADVLREVRKTTDNIDLKNFYAAMEDNFVEMADIMLVGAAILDAKSRQSTEIATGVLESIVTGDAKSLVAPVVSMFDLDNRIKAFRQLMARRYPAILQSIKLEGERLHERSGIVF